MRIRGCAVWVWLIAFFPNQIVAQNLLDAGDLLRKVSDTYANLQQYTFSATVRFHDPDERLDLSGATVVAVHRPNRVRWEIRGPVTKFFLGTERDYQYVKDGENVWAYFPKLNQYGEERVGKDAPTEGADSPGTISYLEDTFLGRTSMKAVGQTRILREERIPVNGVTADCFVLEIREGPIDIYRWWVEKGTYRVLRYEKESKDSPTANYYSMIIRFTNVQLTGPVDEKLFIFSPPAGSKRVYEPNP